MSPFIEDIIKHRKELKKTRNKWVAHIINQGDFVKELSKPIKHISAQDMILMINGLKLFSKGLEMIFPKQTNYLMKNFTKKIEDTMTYSSVNNKTLEIIINRRIKLINTKFKLHNCAYQFPSF